MSTICPPIDVTTFPYARRQLIIVQPDEVVTTAREAEANAATQSEETNWADVASRVAKSLLRMNLYGATIDVAIDALKAWAKARESGLDVLQIGYSEASNLMFPPGHPQKQAMYVAHPAVPNVYYTAASFHRMSFEHKFAEAIRLLMSLGATKIVVEHVHGWSSEFSANVSAGLPHAAGGVSSSRSESTSSKLLFEAVLSNNTTASLPAATVWYAHEPTWQAVATGRLEYGLQQFSLNVVYDDDFGINAGLKMRAQKAGLEIGGNFEDHVATTWKIHGNFSKNEG